MRWVRGFLWVGLAGWLTACSAGPTPAGTMPSPSPVPSATPTPSPEATGCALVPGRGFGRVWEENAEIRSRLGCPTGQERAVGFVAQRFERGVIFRTDASSEWARGFVFVLDKGDMLFFKVFDTWKPGDPEAVPAPGTPVPPEALVPSRERFV